MNTSSIDHLVRDALGLEWIGETKPAHHKVGPRGAAAIELQVDVLPFGQRDIDRQQLELLGEMLAMQIRRADFDQPHRQFARQKPRQRNFELGVREQENAAAGELIAIRRERTCRAGAIGPRHLHEYFVPRRQRRPPPRAAMPLFLRRPAGTGLPAASHLDPQGRARCRQGTAAPEGIWC